MKGCSLQILLQFAHMEDMCSSYPLYPFIKAWLWDGFCKHPLPCELLSPYLWSLLRGCFCFLHQSSFAPCSLPSLNLDPSVVLRPRFNSIVERTTSVSLTSSWLFMGERKSPFYYFSGFNKHTLQWCRAFQSCFLHLWLRLNPRQRKL